MDLSAFMPAGAALLMEQQEGIRRALAPFEERESAAEREAAAMGDPCADVELTPEYEAAIESQWAALFDEGTFSEGHGAA
ncbi:hypothetical protein [Streptomyces sp. SID3343]|uniref:hypothetical protein n=1 Tax=Streptomyces sp. SID3343 TaxID=2690260 RepID=UPI001370E77F|nr:hypothetical protein [Streptomyces sp. SID3343]MYW01966.1 hypothetical protein [Streptomyces sp. SID3343]